MATLMEIYDEALSMVSSGRDLPTHFSGQMDPQDPTWKVAKRAFEHVNDSLGSSLNWSFLLSKMVLNNATDGYGTPASPGSDPESFDPVYSYRWPLLAMPGFRKMVNVYSDFSSGLNVGDTRYFNNLVRGIPERSYFGQDESVAGLTPVFKPSSKFLYTNVIPLVAVYTKKVVPDNSDEDGVGISAVPFDYKTALIWGMASYLALSQGGSLQKKAYFENKFNHYKYLAQNRDNRSYSERLVILLDTPDGSGGF